MVLGHVDCDRLLQGGDSALKTPGIPQRLGQMSFPQEARSIRVQVIMPSGIPFVVDEVSLRKW